MDMYRYVYAIRNVELTLDQNYTFDDGTCLYMIMKHDYLNRRFPIFQIGLEMDADLIQLFYKNKDTAKLKLDIYEQQLGDDDTVINTSLYLRYTFTCIPMKDQSAYITMPDSTSRESVDIMRTVQQFDMYLIDMDMVNLFAKEVSAILENTSKSAVLQTMFDLRDVQPGIIIATPPMIDRAFPYVSIPLGDLVSNINTFNHGYGIYDSNPIIYYDYKYIYCLNIINPDITIQSASEFGNISFILLNTSNPEHNVVGSNTDMNARTHFINLQNPPRIIDVSDKDTSTKFSTVVSIDSSGKVDKNTVDETATKVKFIRQYNELTSTQLINQTLQGHILQLSTNSCCISFLKPYKSYAFDVDTQYSDKDLSGHDYRLIQWTLHIERDSPDKYIHTVNIVLQKPTRS